MFARFRLIDYRTGVTLATAGIPASILGVWATSYIPRGIFDALFGCLLAAFGGYLLWRSQAPERPPSARRASYPIALGLGSTTGLLSGLLGIGGGFLLTPLLIQVLGYTTLVAAATSQFNLAISALAGTLAHILSGQFDHGLRRTIALGLGVLAGAQVGARLVQRVRAPWIVRALGLILVLAGTRLALVFHRWGVAANTISPSCVPIQAPKRAVTPRGGWSYAAGWDRIRSAASREVMWPGDAGG